ncbi:MAG: carboxymuconolactone decarboxylase family protein [Deltaproteobacteria bacterium]|nr:carboxymuconolactone decarboxylase family protein [Deltaproteobacteria bacterium]
MGEERIRELKERYRKTRDYAPGAIHPGERFFEMNPEWFEKYQKMWEFACGPGKALSVKMRELIIMALSAHIYPFPDRIKMHMRRAIYHGATVEEIIDTATTVWMDGGPAPCWTIFAGLRELEEEAKKLGETFGKGKEWLLLSEVPAVEV